MSDDGKAKADKMKARGIALYKRKDFERAAVQFSLALTYEHHTPLAAARLLANRAATYLEWHHYAAAAMDCASALAVLDRLSTDDAGQDVQMLAQRLHRRSETVAAFVLDAERAAEAAFLVDPMTPRMAMDAYEFALKNSDAGPAGDDVRCQRKWATLWRHCKMHARLYR
jgi:tetratricopeptide (TPR) repeat protein